MSRELELEDEISFFGRNHAKAIDRILKKALAREKEKALKGAGRANAVNIPRNTLRAARKAYSRATVKAIVRAAASPKETARPDLGTGRSFHFNLDRLRRNQDGSSSRGKAAASGQYIERENAVEMGEIDLAEFMDRRREEDLDNELGLTAGGRYQSYIENDAKVERESKAFSFGTIGQTPEDRAQFWTDVEDHFPEKSRLQYKLILGLPHEATPEMRLRMMADFTDTMFREKDIPFWCALHAPTGDNDDRNYHAHVVFLGRPASMVVHPDRLIRNRKGETSEGSLKLTWDFAAQVIDNTRGYKKTTYPFRQPQSKEILNINYPLRARRAFSLIVNKHMKLAGLPGRYDPRSLADQGIKPMVDLQRNAIDLLAGKREIEKEKDAVQDIFANEHIRTERIQLTEQLKITHDKLALQQIANKRPQVSKAYAFAGALWRAPEAAIDRLRSNVLTSSVSVREENVQSTRDRLTEITLYRCIGQAIKTTSDPEERRILANIAAVLTDEFAGVLDEQSARHKQHARVRNQSRELFRQFATKVYDPDVDIAARRVARERNFVIPPRLQEIVPSEVTIHPEAHEIGSTPRTAPRARLPYAIDAETIPELVGTTARLEPKGLEILQDMEADGEARLEKKEKDRRRRADRRKALLSQKPAPKGGRGTS